MLWSSGNANLMDDRFGMVVSSIDIGRFAVQTYCERILLLPATNLVILSIQVVSSMSFIHL